MPQQGTNSDSIAQNSLTELFLLPSPPLTPVVPVSFSQCSPSSTSLSFSYLHISQYSNYFLTLSFSHRPPPLTDYSTPPLLSSHSPHSRYLPTPSTSRFPPTSSHSPTLRLPPTPSHFPHLAHPSYFIQLPPPRASLLLHPTSPTSRFPPTSSHSPISRFPPTSSHSLPLSKADILDR